MVKMFYTPHFLKFFFIVQVKEGKGRKMHMETVQETVWTGETLNIAK